MTSTTAQLQLGTFVRMPNSGPLPQSPTRGFCQQHQLGTFANTPDSGLLSESPAQDYCRIHQPRSTASTPTRPARHFFTFGCERPRVWVFNSARALLNTHTRGPGPFCSGTNRPRAAKLVIRPGLVNSAILLGWGFRHKSRVGSVGKSPELVLLTESPSWGLWQRSRVGNSDKSPELGLRGG